MQIEVIQMSDMSTPGGFALIEEKTALPEK